MGKISVVDVVSAEILTETAVEEIVMNWIRELFAAFAGFCSGLLAAGGVFALISTINILPRLASKTKTEDSVLLYENMILFGGVTGCVISTTEFHFALGDGVALAVLMIYFLFSGIFVGCLATALAETINTIPVYFRRARLTVGLGWVVLALALGKSFGNLLQYLMGWTE
ncbi:MAG: stage V sporulation protein AB [Lachnospiraceae bacterium]|nr:stage V sporulation protein AB [Lachnospiraceae bacterium]